MDIRHLGLPVAFAIGAAIHQMLPSQQAAHNWYVDGRHGSNGNNCMSARTACRTIAHAIALSSSNDSVFVAGATYRENLALHHNVTIEGAGAEQTIVDGGGISSVIFTAHRGLVITISRITLRNGGGIGDGGAIYNCMASVTITQSVITESSAHPGRGNLGYGGGTYNCPGGSLTIIESIYRKNNAEDGGAICNGGALTIEDSTFSDNVARSRRGGAIFNYGTLTVVNSTLARNSALNGTGGAIHTRHLFGQTGTLSISSSTLARNTAAKAGGVFELRKATAVVQNSIVADNSPENCSGHFASDGYNLSSDGSCTFHAPGDLNGARARLGPLQDNGGLTPTMALPAGSPGIDAGNPDGCTDGRGHLLIGDQRGKPRPDQDDTLGCDAGAFERETV